MGVNSNAFAVRGDAFSDEEILCTAKSELVENISDQIHKKTRIETLDKVASGGYPGATPYGMSVAYREMLKESGIAEGTIEKMTSESRESWEIKQAARQTIRSLVLGKNFNTLARLISLEYLKEIEVFLNKNRKGMTAKQIERFNKYINKITAAVQQKTAEQLAEQQRAQMEVQAQQQAETPQPSTIHPKQYSV